MRKHYWYLVLILIAFLAFSLIIGCGKGGDRLVLAKVGSDEITSQELNDIFNRNRVAFASYDEELEQRQLILDSLVIQQLLIQEAYRRGLDNSEELNRIILANNDRFLLDVLYQREISDKVEVSESEIQDYYEKLKEKVHLSHILLTTEDSARMVLDSLKAGANFENMAIIYSKDPGAKNNRGDLGFVIWGKMDNDFQTAAFKMNPGEVSEPVKTRYGWHIIKMIDRQPNEPLQSMGKISADIKSSIENIKMGEILEKYKEKLTAQYPVKVDTPTCTYLLNRRASLYPPQLLETSIPKNDFDANQLDRDEKEMILATWPGGQTTLGQYLLKIKTLRRQIRGLNPPDFDQTDSLASFIFQINLQDILIVEARNQNIENDAEYKRKIKRFKELAMADVMENDSLPMAGPPDDGEMRQYYEEHSNEFMIPPQVHVYEIMVGDYVAAKQYKAQAISLDQFKKLAGQYTERPGKRSVSGDLGYIEERYYPEIFRSAMVTPIGYVAGPLEISGKYSVIYVADKKAEDMKDFLAVKQSIKDTLEKQRKRKALESWVAQKRTEVDIKINENNLRATINAAKYQSDSTGGS
jgi:parvulin-like peptidyl-prolyl isomerase